MKIYKIAQAAQATQATSTEKKTLNVGNVGSLDNDNDRNRYYIVDSWLDKNDPKYMDNAAYTHDHIDLSRGRDFLKESGTYDIVILQHIFNPTDSKDLRDGIYKISPNHTSENWVARLASTNADYIFVWGGYTEVGAWWLGHIPGYDVADRTAYDMTVYRKKGLSPIKVEEEQPIDWDKVDVSWMEDLKPDALDNITSKDVVP